MKLLVSRCLLGDPVRFDGQGKLLQDPLLRQWQQQGRIIGICPECAGGLPIPRPPAELQWDGRVIDRLGQDVTTEFMAGANVALALCRQYEIRYALLKANSPSCGAGLVYNGAFDGTLVPGEGVTAALLSQHGVQVFTEQTWPELKRLLSQALPHG